MIVTLPPELAARAGCTEVDVELDDVDCTQVYLDGVRLKCFSWADHGIIRDLYDRATIGTVRPDAQSMARVGPEPYKTKRRKSRRREDNQLRAPEGERYEDV